MAITIDDKPRAGKVFLDPAAPTLQAVIDALDRAEPEPRRRGELASGIRTVCRVLGYAPHELPADAGLLGRRIRKAVPAAAGVSLARWANARSLLTAAMALTGLRIMPGRRLYPLGAAWAALALALPDTYQRAMLSRLLRWCSALGIEPAAVTPATFEAFRRAVLDDSLLEHPWATWRQTVLAWNRAVNDVPGWPQVPLVLARKRATYARPLCAFPASFQADVRRWLDRLAGKGGLDEGPLRPVRATTLAKWTFSIRQMASALVERGRGPDSLTGLADLVTPEAAEAILSFFYERAGRKACAQTRDIAAALKALARHHAGASEPVLASLRRMAGTVTPKAEGMTAKNRATLRQFGDEARQRQLVNLPATIFARLPATGPVPMRLAVRLQSALAVALLLAAPMRLRNLCRLEPGRHLQHLGHGRQRRSFVIIPGDEVKNGEAIELPLPDHLVELLERYRSRVQPVLAPGGSPFLFPGQHGPKAEVSLGTQVPRFLQRELGIRLSVHQFRHLVGYLYLQHHPNGHEVVRRMLGHRDIRTTIRFYAGMETTAAAKAYEAILDGLRDPGRGRRRR
jgi:integrase